MQNVAFELLAELVEIIVVGGGTMLFTGIGILGEQAGLADVLSGDPTLGAWELYIGTWALFVGLYLLGAKQVLPRLRGRLAAEH